MPHVLLGCAGPLLARNDGAWATDFLTGALACFAAGVADGVGVAVGLGGNSDTARVCGRPASAKIADPAPPPKPNSKPINAPR